MGTRCSTTGIKGIVIPSKKIDPNLISPPNGRRSSAGIFRTTKADDKTTDTVRSPDNPLGVTIKHRGTQGDAVDSTGKHGSMTQLSETFMNTQHTESSSAKPHSQYKKGPEIGKGTYSEVYESLDLNTGELLAVKSFKIHGDAVKISNYIETLKKEITSLRNLGHQNIVKYYTCDITRVPDSNYAIVNVVLEYVSGKSVRKLLDNFCGLEEKVVGTYIRQVLEGLAYLHLNGIVHRNIKGSNILIDTAGTIKLTDFGCSGRPDRFSEDNPQENHKASAKNLAFWSAPEVIMRKSQGKPADVWSVGCVVIEMLTGQPPWSNFSKNPDEFIRQISSGTPPPLPKDISENCRDFLFRTFKFKPEDRPSPLDLLDHPFVRDHYHDHSDIEAESVQTFSYNAGTGKNLDFFIDPKSGERKYMDLKTNNFVKKQIKSKNLSMSNINFVPGNSIDSHGRVIRKATEANFYEDSARQSDPKGSFFKFRRNSTKRSDQLFENPQFVNDFRTRTFGDEGEITNNYMQENLSQLKKKQLKTEIQEQQEKNKGEKRPIMKNLLFADSEEASEVKKREDQHDPQLQIQHLDRSPKERRLSEKPSGKKNVTLNEESVEKVEDISSQMDRNSVSTVPLVDNKQEVSEVKDEAELKLMQEKLRRQFEEQMEISLARGNSEKFDGGFDGFEASEMGDVHVTDKITKNNFEEGNSSQYVKTSTDHLKDFWKADESSALDIDKTTNINKADEDMLGNFRGVWETHAEEIEASLKRSPSAQTESEGRSPNEKHARKSQGEPVFVNKDSFYGIEREENSGEFQVTDLDTYKEREREMMVNDDEGEKLGIINEAEEIKEDSGDEAERKASEEVK